MQLARSAMIAASVLVLSWSGQAAVTPRVTDYCLVEPLEGGSGGVKKFDLGDYVMKARLIIRGSHYVLTAWNTMPDSGQILTIDADGIYQLNGPTRFRFIDNFDNHG